MLKIEKFAKNFPGYPVPEELSLLLTFEQKHGAESYSQGFSLSAGDESAVASWSKDKDFLKRFMTFASANGTGSVYGIWDDGKSKPLNERPVVVFGDEGGVHIVAKNIVELMHLLTYDAEISVDHEEAYFYKDEDDDEETENAQSYKDWLKEKFNLDEVNDPGEIVASAQNEYKASFDTWFAQYYSL